MAMKKGINDLTDEFDTRLGAMRVSRAPIEERDAATAVYERMRSARAICQALLPGAFSEAAVLTVLGEISLEARQRLQSSKSSE